jgi:hypothetical protein
LHRVPALAEYLLGLELATFVGGLAAEILSRLFHGDSSRPLELGLARLTGRHSPEYQPIPLWTFLILDDPPQLSITQPAALVWIGLDTGKDPEAIIPLMILAESKLSQCDSHYLFTRITVGNLDYLGDAASGYDTDNLLTLW